ncbi:hypothetical protein [Piscinibacterium candidicorallinum]|uniref:Uncharacterized protein n=1 Tax=Piscinibacterium candidicorallinum TaxID=1793872 RepID=A0ABV7H142_9BURK
MATLKSIRQAEGSGTPGLHTAMLVWLASPTALALLALVLSEEFVAESPSVAAFCSTVLNAFPFLAQPDVISARPKLAEFLTCLSFVMIPHSLAAAWWVESRQRAQLHWRLARGRARIRSPWLLIPLAGALLGVVFFGLYVLPGHPSSRFMHAFIEAAGLMAITKFAVLPLNAWLVLHQARRGPAGTAVR